ncbi:unnamed protein product [Cladocopium goreaui]|uniref:Protein roadkill n=1 Tax=Cladocopium goreaui TaxID=2562237 RepID=A0A9P1CGJ6_9DINO|nr:unnamed protein product [Cladocopium goreaui]
MLSFREALAEDEFPVCPEGENDLDPSDGWDVDFSLEDAVRPEIRLYAGARPDVTLCCNGGRKLLAHRRILAEVGYFESLFQDLDQVDLTVEEDLETFLEVIRWIYCRSATSDKERALDLLRLAESYEIEGLIDHAARVLAAPFSCPTDGENVLDEERLEKEDHDIVKAFLHEEESPKEGIPPKPHKMKDV